MCPDTHSFQHHVFCDTVWCIWWLGYWNRHSILHWRLCLQTQKTSSKDQGENRYRWRVSVRRQLSTEYYYQSQHAEQRWQVLSDLWQLWPNLWDKKNRRNTLTSSWKTIRRAQITIKGKRLMVVEKFNYLGSTPCTSNVMGDEVNTRLAKVNAAFGRLNRNAWNRWGISEGTKIMVYRAVRLTIILFGCETCTT